MTKTTTSPKANKIIVLYNDSFFNTIYKEMCNRRVLFYKDPSGTLWHLDDVASIIAKRKIKIK